MTGFRPYSGVAGMARPTIPRSIDTLSRAAFEDPALYQAESVAVDAVNVALALGLPLLVEGAPGCGKTMLGRAVAHEFGWAEELHAVKSTSRARDLFYAFDDVGRFRQAQIDRLDEPRKFVTYGALGRALLRAHEPKSVAHLLPEQTAPGAFAHPGAPQRSVVIIDEIDKAPRDFPNDLLHEIDRMQFEVPELQPAVAEPWPKQRLDAQQRPFVVFTSNRERRLPDAFLRRCVYCFIDLPSRERLESIAARRLVAALDNDAAASSPLLRDLIGVFAAMRDLDGEFEKAPGTSEFLNWLQASIQSGAALEAGLSSPAQAGFAERAFGALFKSEADVNTARRLFVRWLEQRRGSAT